MAVTETNALLSANGAMQEEQQEVGRDNGGINVATKRRVTVPLLPPVVRELDAGLEERVQRAKRIISSTVSSKPAKLARYDNQSTLTAMNDRKDLQLLCKELVGEGHNLSHMDVHMSFCSADVIPLDMLKMEQRHTPLDVKAFLSRVSTFDLKLWSGKAERLCSFHCARYGWRIAGKNTLLCVSCRQLLTIPQDNGCCTLDEWVTNMEQYIRRTGHMSDCIWVKSPSPVDILLLPEGNDMQTYMKMAAESFNRLRTLPEFTLPYRHIMQTLNMDGLKQKTELHLTQQIEGATLAQMEEISLFLMLNGWIMDESDINALKCEMCLRQVPVWLCLPTPSICSIQEFISPPSSPAKKARMNMAEFDPLKNHWFWCPWRKMLHRTDQNLKMKRFLEVDKTNLYDMEGLSTDYTYPELEAYMTLAIKLDADFKRGRLLHGPNLEMSDNDTAIRTITSFKELLNSATSPRSGKGVRSRVKKTLPLSQKTNDIISVKESTARLFRKIPSPIETLQEMTEETLLNDDETCPMNISGESYDLKESSESNNEIHVEISGANEISVLIEKIEESGLHSGLRITAKVLSDGDDNIDNNLNFPNIPMDCSATEGDDVVQEEENTALSPIPEKIKSVEENTIAVDAHEELRNETYIFEQVNPEEGFENTLDLIIDNVTGNCESEVANSIQSIPEEANTELENSFQPIPIDANQMTNETRSEDISDDSGLENNILFIPQNENDKVVNIINLVPNENAIEIFPEVELKDTEVGNNTTSISVPELNEDANSILEVENEKQENELRSAPEVQENVNEEVKNNAGSILEVENENEGNNPKDNEVENTIRDTTEDCSRESGLPNTIAEALINECVDQLVEVEGNKSSSIVGEEDSFNTSPREQEFQGVDSDGSSNGFSASDNEMQIYDGIVEAIPQVDNESESESENEDEEHSKIYPLISEDEMEEEEANESENEIMEHSDDEEDEEEEESSAYRLALELETDSDSDSDSDIVCLN